MKLILLFTLIFVTQVQAQMEIPRTNPELVVDLSSIRETAGTASSSIVRESATNVRYQFANQGRLFQGCTDLVASLENAGPRETWTALSTYNIRPEFRQQMVQQMRDWKDSQERHTDWKNHVSQECLRNGNPWFSTTVEEWLHVNAIPEHSEKPIISTCDMTPEEWNECFADAALEDFKELADITKLITRQLLPFGRDLVKVESQKERGCRCLQDKINTKYPEPEQLEKARKDAQERVNRKIVYAAGELIMDDLASTFEDVNFYKISPSNLIEPKENSSHPLFCLQQEGFEAALKDNNKCDGLSDSQKSKRLSQIFNSIGPLSPSENFNELLQAFENKIYQFIPSDSVTPYTRNHHDVRRYSLTQSETQVKMMENAISSMLQDRSIFERIRNKVENETSPKSPKDAILEVIIEDTRTGANKQLPSYLVTTGLKKEYLENLNAAMKSPERGQFASLINGFINHSMVLHPGFSMLMTDKTLFTDARDSLINSEVKSFFHVAENDPDLVLKRLHERCQSTREKFAELVCTSDEDLMQNINSIAANEIVIEAAQDQLNRVEALELNRSLLCEVNFSASSTRIPIMHRNVGYNPVRDSDFRGRMKHPQNRATPFERLYTAEQVDPDIKQEISAAVVSTGKKHQKWASQIGGRYVDSDVAELLGFQPEEAIRAPASLASTEPSERPETKRSQEPRTEQIRQPVSNYSVVPQTAAVNVPAPLPAPAQNFHHLQRGSALQNLFDMEDNEEIENHLSNLDSEQVQELERLRQEVLLDRQKAYELSNQMQRDRLRELQDQIQQLENQKKNPREVSGTQSTDRGMNGTRNLSSSDGVRNISEATNLAPAVNANTGDSSGSAGGASRGSVSPSTASSNSSSAARGTASEHSSMPLIITLNSPRTSDLAPQDLSQEVINYLTQNDPELVVLTQIKERGMLYRFKVVENGIEREKEVLVQYDLLTPEARRVLEAQIARKRQTQVAQIDQQLQVARRTHSYEALKFIIGQEALGTR